MASLSDVQKLSRIGGKTIGIYLGTTFIALVLGLAIVNIMKPGNTVPEEVRLQLEETYSDEAAARREAAEETKERGPLQAIVDMVPANFFFSASE